MTSLSDERIKELYAIFDEGRGANYGQWIGEVEAHLEWAAGLSDAELATPKTQRELWRRTGIGTAGRSESLTIEATLGDPELTRLYIQLRRSTPPPDPTPRAKHFQSVFDRVLQRVELLVENKVPRARLRRLFLSLRPSDGHPSFQIEALTTVHGLLGGRTKLGPIECGSLSRARLREVLGPEDGLHDQALRCTFCWWLYEQHDSIARGAPLKPAVEISAPDVNLTDDDPPEAPTWTGERIYQLWQSDAAQAAYCAGLAENTISTYRQAVNTVLTALRAAHGDQPVDLDNDVLRAITQQWGRGATPQTVTGYRFKWNRWVAIANTLGLPLRPLTAEQPSIEPPAPAAPLIPEPTLAELRDLFQNDAQTANLIFPPELLRGLYAAWSFHARKRFVLLSGLSGTGKTALLQHTARLSCAHMGLDPAEHVALVAVGPDWRDPTALLGYWSALHAPPTFHAEAALRLVLRAVEDPARPYFLLLDEMNLAPVERYLAPFLSAMESGADLQLHGEDDVVNGVPNKVCWPANLRIGGTVNMDETTYPFSDKVLDRAFTFEFWQVDLDGLFARRGQAGPTEAPAQAALRALQAHLEPIRRHVGYRALTEALDWIAACQAAEPEAPIAGLIDEAVFSKVLPRLRGSESSALSQALERVQETCRTHDLPRCAAKVAAMAGRLRDSGVTSFWS